MKGLNYTLSKTETLSAAKHLRRVQVSATLNNAAVSITGAPDAATAQFLLNVSSAGKSSTARLAAHPGSVFLPDFDPGALETLLAIAVTQNNRNLWAIVPKQVTGPDGTVQAGSIASIELATYADEQGTLDSQPIAVHHLVANIAGIKTHIFSGPDNQLLQAELPQQGFALVRDGFVLTPPTKPGAPPVQPAAPAPVQQ
jgi:predicted metal-dependent enzyme (double-stranded beta helix superfamily)